MYLTVHTPTSLIIGTQIHQPFLAFIFAFLTHLILDIIPHDPIKLADKPDKKTIKRLAIATGIDLILVVILLAVLSQKDKLDLNLSIFTAVIGGIMPDILWGSDVLTKDKIKVLKIYRAFHSKFLHCLIISKGCLSIKWSVLVQASVFIITLLIYLAIS